MLETAKATQPVSEDTAHGAETSNEPGKQTLAKQTLEAAIAFCQATQPDLVSLFNKPGDSFDFVMHGAIINAKSKELKARLVELLVYFNLSHGKLSHVVEELEFGQAARLDLPQFDMKFLSNCYEQAISQGNASEAWDIAQNVLSHRSRMVKSSASIDAWKDKADIALGQMLAEILLKVDQAETINRGLFLDLDLMFMRIQIHTNRQFGTGKSAVAQLKVAQTMVRAYFENGDENRANSHAEISGLDEATVAALKKDYFPDSLADRYSRLVNGLKRTLKGMARNRRHNRRHRSRR